MLYLKELIGKGATRECYQHPLDNNKCIKIVMRNNKTTILSRELRSYPYIKSVLDNFVVEYDAKLVETDKGFGLVCELLRDDNGELSKPIIDYIENYTIDKELQNELNFFVYNLIEHNLFFYDFNLKNFVIQKSNGKKKLKYIDLKSFENNKSWCFMKLERFINSLAMVIMIRRLKRLYKQLNIKFFE